MEKELEQLKIDISSIQDESQQLKPKVKELCKNEKEYFEKTIQKQMGKNSLAKRGALIVNLSNENDCENGNFDFKGSVIT